MGTATTLVPQGIHIEPQTFGFFRLAIGAPVLLCAGLLVLQLNWSQFRRRHLALTVLFGIMLGIFQIGFFTAVERLGVAVGTLATMGTAPILAAAFSGIFLQERISSGTLLAGLAAILGIACLTGPRIEPKLDPDLLATGIGAGLVGGAAFALLTIIGRILVRSSAPPLAFTALGLAIGAAVLLPFAIQESVEALRIWQTWPVLFYLGAVPSALAYILYVLGMQRVRTAAAGTIGTLVEPMTAMLMAYMIVGERLTFFGWAGAALLLVGLLLLFHSEARGSAGLIAAKTASPE